MNGWWLRAAGGLSSLIAALIVSSLVMAAIYYLLPRLHLWRGTAALAAIPAFLGVLALQPLLNRRRHR